MSSRPGLSLEDYLAWAFDLTVEDQQDPNESLRIAELLGTATRHRPLLTKETFAPIIAMFEKHREQVEYKLLDFDEDNQSWRDYAGYNFDFLPEELDNKVFTYLEVLKEKEPTVIEIATRREMILLLFKQGIDFANPRSLVSDDQTDKAQLAAGWVWRKDDASHEYVAVCHNGEIISSTDVKAFIEGLTTSYMKLHPEVITQEQGNKVEYITKQTIKSIRPFVVLPKVVKNLCDSVALIAAHSHYDGPQQDNFVKSRVSGLLRDISSAIVPSNLDYFTGNGPMARYLREHLAVEMLLENIDGSYPITLSDIRKEIDQKFNLNPNGRLDSVEWKNIIISIIELQARFFAPDDTTYDSAWKQVPPTQPITESGLYLYDDGQKVINLVFKVDGISVTMTILADQDPMVNVYHEWEEANINVYGICFFPGMFKAMTEEIEKLAK